MSKTKRFTFFAACLLAVPVLLSAQGIGTVENDLQYGRDFLARGNPSSAATFFRQAVSLHPEHAEANLLLAVALQRSGNAEEAWPFYEKAIALDPSLSSRPEVRAFAIALGDKPPATSSLIPDAPNYNPPPQSVTKEEPVGSAGYFLNYARSAMRDRNFSSAADYAKEALAVDGDNAEARAILRDAQRRKPPANLSGATSGRGGDPQQVGTPAYLLTYAKHHFDNGSFKAAADYARQALAVDPDYDEAKQLLALASGRPDKGATNNSCDAQFGTCYASAMTYTPGSGYRADYARRQQCFVERNLCSSSRR